MWPKPASEDSYAFASVFGETLVGELGASGSLDDSGESEKGINSRSLREEAITPDYIYLILAAGFKAAEVRVIVREML